MKLIAFGLGVLLACWIVTPSAAQQTPDTTKEPAHNVFVLTGCLEGGAAASAFKLTGASAVGQPPRPTPPGPSSAGATAGTTSVYELQPISSISEQGINREGLQTHVGKRVEVTVRPVEAPATTPSSGSTATKVKPEEQAPQRYTVIKIGRLADSCV
jgi:hypothetical protein